MPPKAASTAKPRAKAGGESTSKSRSGAGAVNAGDGATKAPAKRTRKTKAAAAADASKGGFPVAAVLAILVPVIAAAAAAYFFPNLIAPYLPTSLVPSILGSLLPKVELSEFHKLEAIDVDGNVFKFDQLRGKVVLVANVASKCSYTPQYAGLQDLYARYKDKGFEVVAFPSNEFGGQEPGENKEIKGFAADGYGVQFPLMAKTNTNGPAAHPVFRLLTAALPNGKDRQPNIAWNFEKFIISRNGTPVERHLSTTRPKWLQPEIEKWLEEV
ncbi:thioredoxin-like protein [Gonapodya prolifera JEL478]|uniref:Glutathione peroxidase n=1 Tax=Gonapodya prolifera (strain JEL478) TaxID=1344416 RepID=A0A139AWE2_GONPJ|nr:thioredoxin-like protein [Gonapodya prolifera JEL478]|eukprot:KXS21040.1 thioredoxin-like protein [Gonapodya prolifera JEL478]